MTSPNEQSIGGTLKQYNVHLVTFGMRTTKQKEKRHCNAGTARCGYEVSRE